MYNNINHLITVWESPQKEPSALRCLYVSWDSPTFAKYFSTPQVQTTKVSEIFFFFTFTFSSYFLYLINKLKQIQSSLRMISLKLRRATLPVNDDTSVAVLGAYCDENHYFTVIKLNKSRASAQRVFGELWANWSRIRSNNPGKRLLLKMQMNETLEANH